MNILYTGRYYPMAARDLTVRQGLRAMGAEVHEVCIPHTASRPYSWKLSKELKKFDKKVDLIILAALGQEVAKSVFAYANKHSLPVISDFLISFHDSLVSDRKVVSENSLKARYFKKVDRLLLEQSDAVVFDTEESFLFAEEQFPESIKQHALIPVGAPEHFFDQPDIDTKKEDGFFKVVFCGTCIPLQGIEYILKAAKKIQDKDDQVQFSLIVKEGQTYHEMLQLSKDLQLTNTRFEQRVDYEHLPQRLKQYDLALGIFGDSAKADRVLPHKVYEALALGLPCISKKTKASSRLLTDDCCRLVASDHLAHSILELKNNPDELKALGQRGHEKALNDFQAKSIAKKYMELINSVLNKA